MITNSLVIASYNILHPAFAVKNGTTQGVCLQEDGTVTDNWNMRSRQIAANMADADIVCLQEADPLLMSDLHSGFTAATYGSHRRGNEFHYHGTAVLARYFLTLSKPHRFLWNQGTPDARTATAMYVTLPDNGPRILIASVHPDGYWDGEQKLHKLEASKEKGHDELFLCITEAERYKNNADAIIIAGDYNEALTPPGQAFNRHALLRMHGYRHDGNMAVTEPATGRKIDWIYVWSKGRVTVEQIETTPPFPDASDHLPVKTRLVFG